MACTGHPAGGRKTLKTTLQSPSLVRASHSNSGGDPSSALLLAATNNAALKLPCVAGATNRLTNALDRTAESFVTHMEGCFGGYQVVIVPSTQPGCHCSTQHAQGAGERCALQHNGAARSPARSATQHSPNYLTRGGRRAVDKALEERAAQQEASAWRVRVASARGGVASSALCLCQSRRLCCCCCTCCLHQDMKVANHALANELVRLQSHGSKVRVVCQQGVRVGRRPPHVQRTACLLRRAVVPARRANLCRRS